jgi:PAS domain S-box-containing protein
VVAQQISAALDPDTILATMLEMAVRATSANAGTVALLQEGEDTWKIIQYNDSGILQRSQRTRQGDEGVLGQVVRSRETLLIRDTREMVYGFAAPSPTSYLSAVAVPLISDGKVIGVLHMESLRTDFFAGEQVGFLDNLARHAVISIENARLLEERQHQIMTLRHLQGLSLRLSSVTETSYVAQEVVRTALDLLHGRKGALFRLSADDEQRRLELLADVSEDADTVSASQLFRNSAGATRAAQTGEIQILHEMRPISDGDPVRLYAISVPIKRGERVREILCIGFEGQRTFSKRELESISLLATQAAGHLENATLHEYIRARNDRMRAILNSTRDGVILLDKQGRLVETNPAARRLLGVDLDERLGENLVDVLLQFASGDVFERAGYTREEVTALARQLRLEPQLISRREFSRSMPGQMLYIEEIGSPVMGSDGQIVGRLLVLRDITKQKQLDEYREEITHMAVHDLRGPLASLDSANNLMHLIESLLDISRLEKREMPLRRAPTRAADLVDAVETTLSSSIHEAAVTIQRDLPDGLPLLNVDPDIVRRVLINLVDNALRFTPSGSTILIQALECPDTVLLRVADSGPGIPEEDREHVFERFRQVKNNLPARGTRGSGLGLTFCRLAVEAHGGRIWVERESPLPGASIAVLLPSTPAPDS